MLEDPCRVNELSSEQSNDQKGSLNMSDSKGKGSTMPSGPNWEDVDLSIVDEAKIDTFSGGKNFSDAQEYGIMLSELRANSRGAEDYLRAIEMLQELMRINVRTDIPNMRFEPYCILNGCRTSAAEDFIGKAVDEIELYADHAAHLIVKARLKHLAWYLERDRRDVGIGALDSYIELLNDFDVREYCDNSMGKRLSDIKYDIICIAYCVLRGLGYPESHKASLKSIAKKVFRESCKNGEVRVVQDFVNLSLSCDLIDRECSVNYLQELIGSDKFGVAGSVAADLWNLCARVYQSIDKSSEAHRCRVKAAEIYIKESEHFELENNHLLAVHWIECAIMAYRGVPGASEKRRNLRKKLTDMQEEMLEQLGTTSTPLDVSKLAESTKDKFGDIDLYESLRIFTLIVRPPTSDERAKQTDKLKHQHTFLSILPHQRLDGEGKTVARSSDSDGTSVSKGPGFNIMDDIYESVHRISAARGHIDVARAIISKSHFISVDFIFKLLGYSWTVPHDLRQTLSIGFERYFAGDMVSASYILTPLLEGMIRHVLKLRGCCVTRFDESDGTQENLSLSGLIGNLRYELDHALDPEYVEEISKVFVERHGPNLRNRVVHAEMHDEQANGHDVVYACYLIWLLAVVPLLQNWDEISSELKEYYPSR